MISLTGFILFNRQKSKRASNGKKVFNQLIIEPKNENLYDKISTDDVVTGQEHSPLKTRAPRGFSILRDQVLVLCSGQELGPIADLYNV